MFNINAEDMPHTPLFQKAAGTDFAHTEALRAGKANALTGLEVLLDDSFYRQVREEWEETMRGGDGSIVNTGEVRKARSG